MKKMNFLTICSGALLLLSAQGAVAIPYLEAGDAGDSLGTAQAVGDGTTSIMGSGGGGNDGDVDMFAFGWGGGGLQIDTFAPFTFDTQLFLFDSSGFGVWANDDHDGVCTGSPGDELQSCLDLTGGLAAGTYYLGLSEWNKDPRDAGPSAMFDCDFTDQCPPVGGGGSLASWTGAPDTAGQNPYTINFSAPVNGPGTTVPEPGTLVLLGIGIFGLGIARRKRG